MGHRSNRNWILGNWILECQKRIPIKSRVLWLPISFAKKRKVEKLFPKNLPKADVYFFSYPSTFSWFAENSRIANRSIVLYTHNEQPELGSDESQAELLNQSHSVHFFSSTDAERLHFANLQREKIRIANGAIDLDLPKSQIAWNSREPVVVLASQFGYRKAPDRLPVIVRAMKDWNFVLLGRKWENFLRENSLNHESNFEYFDFSKDSRNYFFPKGKIFLSFSILEGGPIPLLESIYSGMVPIVSDTGFARDLLGKTNTSNIFRVNADNSEIVQLIQNARQEESLREEVSLKYTWDRIARLIVQDSMEIFELYSQKGTLDEVKFKGTLK